MNVQFVRPFYAMFTKDLPLFQCLIILQFRFIVFWSSNTSTSNLEVGINLPSQSGMSNVPVYCNNCDLLGMKFDRTRSTSVASPREMITYCYSAHTHYHRQLQLQHQQSCSSLFSDEFGEVVILIFYQENKERNSGAKMSPCLQPRVQPLPERFFDGDNPLFFVSSYVSTSSSSSSRID